MCSIPKTVFAPKSPSGTLLYLTKYLLCIIMNQTFFMNTIEEKEAIPLSLPKFNIYMNNKISSIVNTLSTEKRLLENDGQKIAPLLHDSLRQALFQKANPFFHSYLSDFPDGTRSLTIIVTYNQNNGTKDGLIELFWENDAWVQSQN